ncbi:MAG: DNA recombination protein RmuC [Chloroflexi bacterium]|nr:DNA recombination protein RmuC [Chloroflexota bacterium]
MSIGELITTLDGLSLFIGAAVGLLGGVMLLLFSRFSMKRSFDRAMTEQKSAFEKALSENRNAYETATREMKSSFESLSNEALLRNQREFLELASNRFEDQEKQHINTLEGKKELIDQQLQSMSKSMTNTLNTVPSSLEKNEKNVSEVIGKSAEQLKESNQNYLNRLSDKAAAQTKEHFTNLENKEVQINRTLGEMKDKLGKVEELIQEFEKARESKLGALDDQLKNLTQTTSALHRALADNRARGQWGERIAEDLLQLLGFVEGRNYYKQMTQASGERPDFTICLPNGLYVNMDVKYSFDNYDSYHNADSQQNREKYAKAFLRNVKNVVNDVASKEYINEQTVDCVLLLIPNEPVYRFIHEQDYTIMDAALRSKVILCSPLNLYPVLAVIHQAAQSLAFERKSREVFAVLTDIRAEWAKYTEYMDGMEKNFSTLERKFRELTGARSNQLDRKFDKIDNILEGNSMQAWEDLQLPQLPADST